jgi:hypothetical protein
MSDAGHSTPGLSVWELMAVDPAVPIDRSCRCPGQSASTPQTRLEHGKALQGRIVGDGREPWFH